MRLSWEVDDVDVEVVIGKLEDGIEDGMERAVENIIELLERDAVNTIRVNDRIFNKQLLNSFTDQTESADIESGLESRFLNTARHAGAVEYGVHHSKYADGGPPIAALMPWVIENLQDWNLSDNDPSAGGNTLKQSVPDDVSQTVDNAVGWTNTDWERYPRLEENERNNIEDTLKSSDLDSSTTNEMYNQVRSWKGDSNPKRGETERIVQYAYDVKSTFGIDAEPRGIDLYDPDTTPETQKDALKTLNEISKIYAYNHLDDGSGSFTAHRFPKSSNVAVLGKQIWENPLDSEWNYDTNAVNNYASSRKQIDMFDKGIVHETSVDIEDDLLFTLDHLITGRNDHEAEVHLRGELDYSFTREDIEFSDTKGTYLSADEVLSVDFEAGNFGNLSDDELLVLAYMVKNMAQNDVTFDTSEADSRLDSWLNEFLDRGLDGLTDEPDYKWETWADSIIQG